jgi:replication-associated recombination protein RarA
MFDGLVLHRNTREQLERFIATPSHAILLVGASGMGKQTVAESLAATLLGLEAKDLANYPNYLHVQPDGASISIEAIRQLQKFLQLKTTGQRPLRRAILITDAQELTTEAQNAYLKMLEEPPADTVMILTASSPRALLPTILSRLQTIVVHVPGNEELSPLLAGAADAEARQAIALSGGMPGLLHALLAGDEPHPMLASVAKAKDILQKDTFGRLALVDTLSKQKDEATSVVEALERIAQAGLAAAGAQQDTAKVKRWHHIRKQAAAAREALARSANAKLTLSNLFLHL